MSVRTTIGDKLVSLCSGITVASGYNTTVEFCQRRLLFYDEIEDKPAVVLIAGSELRTYLPGQQSEKHINFIIRAYVNDDLDPDSLLNNLIDDIEQVIETSLFTTKLDGLVTDIRIQEITTDEGLLAPDAVAEIVVVATII